VPQEAGLVVVGGQYLNIQGQGAPSVFRLAANGAYDPTFKVGTAANGPVHALAVSADGKIYIGGNFTNLNGEPRNCVGRILADGTVDKTFDTTIGVKGDVLTIAPLADGRVVVAGEFTSNRRRNIARFEGNGDVDLGFRPPPFGNQQPVTLLLP